MEETLRIRIAGGGTGGHLFPALAVAAELKKRHPRMEITFVGARRGIETRLVPQAGYPLRTLRLSGIKGRGWTGKLTAGAAAAWAVLVCLFWMLASRPALVIGVGGYASGPAMLAAMMLRVKTMVLEQNHFPGATNRWLARRVDAVCLPSEASRKRLGGVGFVTGNPVREAFRTIGDPPDGETLAVLVFGGSRGARSINRAAIGAAERLAGCPVPPSLVLQTGEDDEGDVRRAYADYPDDRLEVSAFFDDMPARLAAADLVVCRAGATTLAELAAAGRPAILVPFPHAADDHQRFNAETVAESGGAIVIRDDELDGDRLADAVERLGEDAEGRARMGRAARALARLDAAERIADIADALIAGTPVEEAGRVS